MTWLIMGVLRIGHSGMESLEFLPHGELLRFLEDTEIDHVFPVLDTLGSSHEDSLEIWADNDQEVHPHVLMLLNHFPVPENVYEISTVPIVQWFLCAFMF